MPPTKSPPLAIFVRGLVASAAMTIGCGGTASSTHATVRQDPIRDGHGATSAAPAPVASNAPLSRDAARSWVSELLANVRDLSDEALASHVDWDFQSRFGVASGDPAETHARNAGTRSLREVLTRVVASCAPRLDASEGAGMTAIPPAMNDTAADRARVIDRVNEEMSGAIEVIAYCGDRPVAAVLVGSSAHGSLAALAWAIADPSPGR